MKGRRIDIEIITWLNVLLFHKALAFPTLEYFTTNFWILYNFD